MAFVVASTVPLRAVHCRPSSYKSGWCKSGKGRLSQCGRKISQLSLQPLNGSLYHSWSPTLCPSSVNLVFSSSSSPASHHGLSRRVSSLDSLTSTSFSSSPFLSSHVSSMAQTPRKRGQSRAENLGLCRSGLLTKAEETVRQDEGGGNGGNNGGEGGDGGGGGGGDAINWISSALVFAFWAGLLVYAYTTAPNQTPYRDTYFIEKLVGLHSDDGFAMNKVLVAEFFIMGCWPLLYSILLIPSGRSRKGGVKVGPFSVASYFVGAFALLPYFGLWRPPPPAVSRDELIRFPLNVLESKITAVASIIAGIILAGYAGFAGADQWAEFGQYLRESRFIHVMSIDFVTLSVLAPFWVYNDLSVRRGSDTISWLLPLSFVPYFGPALYIYLRPPLLSAAISDVSDEEISESRGN